MNWKFHINTLFYIIGSCLFVVGSIFFHPDLSHHDSLYKSGVLAFTIGSFLFWFASFQQLFANFQSISSNEDRPLVNKTISFDIDLAVSFCRNTIGCISGFVFVLGSLAFWPTFGHSGTIVGNWLYRCGAIFGAVSSMWYLIRLQLKSTKFTMMKLVTLLSLFGSIFFLIGGGLFLAGGKYNTAASFGWLAASISFLLSSLFIYKL